MIPPVNFKYLLPLGTCMFLLACGGSGSSDKNTRAEENRQAETIIYIASDGIDINGSSEIYRSSDKDAKPVLMSKQMVNNPSSRILSYAVSPDRKWLAYTADHFYRGYFNLYVVPMSGGEPVKVVNASGVSPTEEIQFFSWSPDSLQLAYTSRHLVYPNGRTPHQVYVVNRDGTNNHRINGSVGSTASVEVKNPQWSPDGRYIVQEVFKYSYTNPFALNLYDTTLGKENSERLVTAVGNIRNVHWSPDSERVSYRASLTTLNSYQLYMSQVSDLSRTQLTNIADFNSDSSWNPQGTELAYLDNVSSGLLPADLIIKRVDSSSLSRIIEAASSESRAVGEYQWSPDGKFIAYTRSKAGQHNEELYVAAADGSQPGHRVSAPSITYGGVQKFSWSPDGTKIAYTADQEIDAFVELYVVQLDAGSVEKLNQGLGSEEVVDFAWAEDSARISFTAGEAGRRPVPDQLYSNSLQGDDLQMLSEMNIKKVYELGYLY